MHEMTHSAGTNVNPKRQRLSTVFILVFVVSLVALPIVGSMLQGGATQWRLAIYRSQHRRGETEQALAGVEKLVKQYPDHLPAQLTRAEWLAEADRDEQALQLMEQLVSQYPQDIDVQRVRLNVFQLTRRFAEAAELMESVELFPNSDSTTRLNGIAYMRALANRNLDKGRLEIERAMEDLEAYFQDRLETKAGLANEICITSPRDFCPPSAFCPAPYG